MDNPPHHPRGDFHLEAGRVGNQESNLLTFSGIGCYRAGLFTGCTGGAFPLAPLLRAAAEAGRATGERFRGRWIDVGTPERLQEVADAIRMGR